MNKDQIIKIAVEAGVNAAIKHIEKHNKEQIKSRYNRRLHNTRLLLKNYKLLKSHCDSSINNFKSAVENNSNAIDILDALKECDDDTFIQAIKKSVKTTYTIMQHVDVMLDLYRVYCEQSNVAEDMRRYRAVKAFYIDKMNPADIARQENVDQRTYYRDTHDAIEKLSALIFGIDGLSEMSKTCQ